MVPRALQWCRRGTAGILLLAALVHPVAAQDAADCRAPAPVCAARAAVYVIAAFDPVGSAVRIGPDLLVTNRHIVADLPTALVTTADGALLDAAVVPSSYPGDLVLLRVAGLGPGPVLAPAPAVSSERPVFTVGADVGSRLVRTYRPGAIAALPAPGFALARLHHDAYSQPGNSGGALLDAAGGLVGITASGGEGRNEAIPATEIARLKQASGPGHAAVHEAIGAAYRACFELLDPRLDRPAPIDDATAAAIVDRCQATGNRQFLEMAGRVLGQGRQLDASIAVLETGVAEDPNALNTRLGLVVSLHFAGRFADELPHLGHLMVALPDDPQVLRFAIQAGKWAGDVALAERAYARLVDRHPQMAPAARRFLDSDIPPPGGAAQ
jgi:hypothetical protein